MDNLAVVYTGKEIKTYEIPHPTTRIIRKIALENGLGIFKVFVGSRQALTPSSFGTKWAWKEIIKGSTITIVACEMSFKLSKLS